VFLSTGPDLDVIGYSEYRYFSYTAEVLLIIKQGSHGLTYGIIIQSFFNEIRIFICSNFNGNIKDVPGPGVKMKIMGRPQHIDDTQIEAA
jgi:hypothetical protein